MPFSYYHNLSRRDRATYRASNAVDRVRLTNAGAVRTRVGAIEAALAAGKRRALEAAARKLVQAILTDLATPPVRVKVLARRPSSAAAELHGLYTYDDGQVPEIRVWMRTAAHGWPVRFRTFLRTVLHEVCHHIDLQHLGLAESFHTEGFFKRESSLMHQIAPPAAPATKLRPAKTTKQLELW